MTPEQAHAAGIQDARRALIMAEPYGAAGIPVIFTVEDFPPAILGAYLRGARTVIPNADIAIEPKGDDDGR